MMAQANIGVLGAGAWGTALAQMLASDGREVLLWAREEALVEEMIAAGALVLEREDDLKATEMHGHMIDFKKRGGFIRNQWRRKIGLAAPDYGMEPATIPPSRKIAELVISTLFVVGSTAPARFVLRQIPESVIGPVFNKLRLSWKKASKPTKRKGLADFRMIVDEE